MSGWTGHGIPKHQDEHPHGIDGNQPKQISKRLILCFDGTGNEFAGNTTDTNIVKLYNMFDRCDLHQMHYYQPGIGTYTNDGASINANWWGKLKRSISKTVDQGVGSTFDSHVIAGYRFLMRYYTPGDRIYIFGFSRGAFTARFLARMVGKVGLLSMGNEEMVPFAYKVYQDYEMDHKKLGEDGRPMDMALYIRNFREAFCRHEHDEQGGHDDESGTKVHFLGLFDTVSSVSTFDVPLTKTAVLPSVSGTAKIVRHAVAIDERRVKFKAALLAQDPDLAQYMHKAKDEDTIPAQNTLKAKGKEDIKEVWFPGNHGDVGGGWPAVPPSLDANSVPQLDHKPTDKKNDAFQLSDIALKWMINELEELDDQVKWGTSKDDYLKRFEDHREKAISSQIHDTLSFGGGTSWLKVLFWNFLEYFPFIKRWELEKGEWTHVWFPLNKGGTRDLPSNAIFHTSVLERMGLDLEKIYEPKNQYTITEHKHIELYKVAKGKESDPSNLQKPQGDETAQLLPLEFKVCEWEPNTLRKRLYCIDVGKSA